MSGAIFDPYAPEASVDLPEESVIDDVHALILEGFDGTLQRRTFPSDPFWKGLRELGTELWLDTGDLDGAAGVWTGDFSALTTNNTLLNAEVQKGIYDDLIARAAGILSGVDERTRILEIAFILNARHGLRLHRRFGAMVSVEEHTDLAQDVDAAVAYGRRYHALCPEGFIVKLPLTPAGLLATRRLRREDIPVNLTLGFSARQNRLAVACARPSYVNVFLGRLGSWVSQNGLGDGQLVGERATLASQRTVEDLSRELGETTFQIAASLRAPDAVDALAGVDVLTMPLPVAEGARRRLSGEWKLRRGEEYTATGSYSPDLRLDVLWDLSPVDAALSEALSARPPGSVEELVGLVRDCGARDLFPSVDREDLARIAADGKIPRHRAWAERVASGEMAVDSLLTLAGLASFTADQQALDDRIRRMGSA